MSVAALDSQFKNANIDTYTLMAHWGIKTNNRYRNWASKKVFQLTFPQRKKACPYYASYPVYRSVVKQIEQAKPDIIFLYPYTLLNWAQQFSGQFPILACGPDCITQTLKRKIAQNNESDQHNDKHINELKRKEQFNREWNEVDCHIKFVGQSDVESFSSYKTDAAEQKCKSSFIKHPLNGRFDKPTPQRTFTELPIKILIYGTQENAEKELIQQILKILSHADLKNNFRLFFKGHDADNFLQIAQTLDLKVETTSWHECYEDLLDTIDIQIFPLLVGAGTKAKVLSALARNVLCIGTEIAFENIHLQHQRSAYFFNQADQLKTIFKTLLQDPVNASTISNEGNKLAHAEHDPIKIAQEFWELND